MSENKTSTGDVAPELAQEIVHLLCCKQITYRDARVALAIAQDCIDIVGNDELRCLPIAKKITIEGMKADLTAVRLICQDQRRA